MLLANIIDVTAIAAHSPIIFLASRHIGFFLSMINSPAANMVTVEAIPTGVRGTAIFVSGLSFSAVGLLASVCAMDDVLGHRLPILFAIGLPFTVLALLMAVWMKETPSYALLTAKDERMAKLALQFYHGKDTDIKKTFEEMRREEELNVGNENSSSLTQVKDLLVKRHLRKAMLISLAVAVVYSVDCTVPKLFSLLGLS